MRPSIQIIALFIMGIFLFGCDSGKGLVKAKTDDPLEAKTYEFLGKIKLKDWDTTYGMLSDDTKKYYPKEDFIAWAKEFLVPKVDYVYVTKIEKHKLDATIFTKFKPNTTWSNYNSMESAKIKLEYVYKGGKWLIHMSDIVMKGMEKEAKEQERMVRVAEWKPHLKISKFKVENKITDEGPMLVFHGEMENTGTKAVEMVMVMANFFDGNDKKVYNVVFVPVYISEWEKREALGPQKKQVFQQSISSAIPDTWSGKVTHELFDAGDMPQKQ